jgi:hypothetical protein
LLLSLKFDKTGDTDDCGRRRCVCAVAGGRGVSTWFILVALLPSLDSVQESLVGLRIAWTP